MQQLTAAHLSLPFDTMVRVTNLENGRSVDLRINDRGPFLKDRVIDVSRAAAERLGMVAPGTANVRVEVVATPTMANSESWTPAAHAPAEEGACTGSTHGVQVGSFRDHANAVRALEDISGRFANARIVSVNSDSGALYRVVVAASNPAAARGALESLRSEGRDGFVTRIPAGAACLAADAS